MPAQLNHTIIWCHDKKRSSAFLVRVLACSPAVPFYNFMVVQLDNGVSLDFMEKGGPITSQHYAFLVEESEFDATFSRIRGEGFSYWADPSKAAPTRSTIMTVVAGSTSKISMATCSRSSHARTEADAVISSPLVNSRCRFRLAWTPLSGSRYRAKRPGVSRE